MKRSFVTRAAAASLLALGVAVAPPVAAQAWPAKPVRFIVPFPPGGSVDPDVRKTLTETLGMDLIVSSPEALQKWLVAEMQRWGKVVRDNNIKAD
jgi:tripartite-type tricarboxylate transporter receptor subunit TctC